MIVVDAGVVLEALIGGLPPEALGEEELAVPHLVDSEVVNAIRGLVHRREISSAQAGAALGGFTGLTLTRHPAARLRTRMWELRENLSAYDATYVALAEALEASELLTTDARLARAPGLRCRVRVA